MRTRPDRGVNQNVSASIRGNASRLAPIISGRKKFANGPTMKAEVIMIIIVPCRPTRVMYCPAGHACSVGLSSSVRISMAFSPPMKKKIPTPKKYWMPITLWLVESRKYCPIAPPFSYRPVGQRVATNVRSS